MIISGQYLTVAKDLSAAEKRKLNRSDIHRIFPGIYVNNTVAWRQLKRWEQHGLLSHAVLLTSPRTILAGHSAAIALGLPVEGCPPRVQVRTEGRNRRTSLTHFIHSSQAVMNNSRVHVMPNDVQFSTTSYEDIVIDSTVWHGAESGIAIADYLLRKKRITTTSLKSVIESRNRFKGIAEVRLVAGLATGWSESPRESVLRLLLAKAGFEDFLIQPTVFDRGGSFLGRVDFLFPQFGLAIEYDGEGKYHGEFQRSREEALQEDVTRHHEFTNAGIRLLRINKNLMSTGQWAHVVGEAIRNAHPRDVLHPGQYKGGLRVRALRQKYQRASQPMMAQ